MSPSHDLLMPASAPLAMSVAAALLAAAAWAALHWLAMPRGRVLASLLSTARLAAGFLAIWLALGALSLLIVLQTDWPLKLLAAIGAVAVEAALLIQHRQTQELSTRARRALTAAGTAAMLLLVFMLAQPAAVMETSQDNRPIVAVLVDDSDSMQIPDAQLPPAQRLRLAAALEEGLIQRPYRLDSMAEALARDAAAISQQVEWLRARSEARIGPEQTDELAQTLDEITARLASNDQLLEQTLAGTIKLDSRLRLALQDVRAQLATRLARPLAKAGRDADAEALAELAPQFEAQGNRLRALAEMLDEAHYNQLSVDDRLRVDDVAQRTRISIAQAILHDGENALLSRLDEQFDVRLYRFASTAQATGSEPKTPADGAGERIAGTNMAAALAKAQREIPASRLAGIVVVGDGIHNAAQPIEPVVRELAAAGVSVSAVAVGSQQPPRDAAVTSIDAPEAVCAEDSVLLTAEIKLDGLAGKEVEVSLVEGGKTLDTRKLRVPGPVHRARVEFTDAPQTEGLRRYRVVVAPQAGEIFADNNSAPAAVAVRAEKTKLLVIEHRPRWEFRYLKNLFWGRDSTVQLQYVLLKPDTIAGREAPAEVPATVTLKDQAEATALPASEEEWMLFDVVVLGDLPPAAIREEDWQAMRAFVNERGGTLIVMAGPHHMPGRHDSAILRELLPVFWKPTDQSMTPPPEESYNIALTDAGRRSAILRQDEGDADSESLWDSLPPLYWRFPIIDTRPGSTVLAYAETAAHGNSGDEADDETQRRRALIVTHNAGLGKVMFLSFDQTWRLRYNTGDARHHRLWGQVVRWAAGGKLPAGTEFVRLGTDRSRYRHGQRVRAKAILRDQAGAPIRGAVAWAQVRREGMLVRRVQFSPVPDAPSQYEADLGTLGGGDYQLALECREPADLLAAEGVQEVVAEFAVDQGLDAERIDLAARRDQLAAITGPTGGVLAEAWSAEDILTDLARRDRTTRQHRQVSLWNSPWLLAALTALLATQWGIRKKVGLP
jgi:hypothetical protein